MRVLRAVEGALEGHLLTLSNMRINKLLLSDGWMGGGYYPAVDATADDVKDVLGLLDHEDPQVRKAATSTLALMTQGDPPTQEMVEAAIRMAVDHNPEVRDAACFVLGRQWREVDTPELREALHSRLDDPDRDTRTEALLGLAYRRDQRALPLVQEALASRAGEVQLLEVMAAGALSDTSLHVLAGRHQGGWERRSQRRLAQAALRLTDPDGPGAGLVDRLGTIFQDKRRAPMTKKQRRSWRLLLEMLDLAPYRAPEVLRLVEAYLSSDPRALKRLGRSGLAQMSADAQGTTCS